MLQTRVLSDHEAVSRAAAEWFVERLRERPDALFCLATGATPMRAYTLIAERCATEPSLFSRSRVLKLDEWGGLAMDDPASCEQYLGSSLVDALQLGDRYVGFQSRPECTRQECEGECQRIGRWLDENDPIDVCVLGLGVNGHLGFNEPADFLQPHAHVATLSEASLTHSMLGTSRSRPTCGLTLGMADILQARRVLLMVTGKAKREPLRRLLEGQLTTQFPASFLALHPEVLVLCDEQALPV